MDVSVSFQIITSFVSIAAGFLFGCFRLGLGLVFSFFGRNRIVTAICDIFAFTVAAFITYCIFLIFTYGNIRGYVLILEFIGLTLYLITLGRLKNKAERKIYLKFKSIKYKIKVFFKKQQKNRKKDLQEN